MSELTRCNYCTLRSIERAYGASNVEVRTGEGPMRGWVEVFVRGKRVASFMALSKECVC